MPAILEDPASPQIYRSVGQEPFPTPGNPVIPSSIFPKTVTLRDRVTIATLIPFFSPTAVPPRLLAYLSDVFAKEVEDGNTYPMLDPLPLETFGPYWFGSFGAVMILGDIGGIEAVTEMERTGADWSKICLGSFYVKPNYPGRSSHICNGGFLVTNAARNKGVGKSMGHCYLDWAPQLGYTYSVFNLVYESNTASTKIWDSLGFKRIGRVPACGYLRSFSEPVDAIIYGRDLKSEDNIQGNEERFDKIRYYLRHSLYPQGADRSEKSRLRSAATHYKLISAHDGVPEKLMLKDKEVVSDPQAQYDIAKQIHLTAHGGINKTTAVIAMKYHWVRIKETVSHVIKNCPECKDTNKPPMRNDGTRSARSKTLEGQAVPPDIPVSDLPTPNGHTIKDESHLPDMHPNDVPEAVIQQVLPQIIPQTLPTHDRNSTNGQRDNNMLQDQIPMSTQDLNNNLMHSTMPMNLSERHMSDDHLAADHMTDSIADQMSAEDYQTMQQQLNMMSTMDPGHAAIPDADADMLNYDMNIDPQMMQEFQQHMVHEFQQQEQAAFIQQQQHQQSHQSDLQQFQDLSRPPLQPHPDIRSDPGPMPAFINTHMQPPPPPDPRDFSQHQSPIDFSQPSSRYMSPSQQPHPMMGHPVPDDHIMSGQLDTPVDTGPIGSMNQIGHVLHQMEYLQQQQQMTAQQLAGQPTLNAQQMSHLPQPGPHQGEANGHYQPQR